MTNQSSPPTVSETGREDYSELLEILDEEGRSDGTCKVAAQTIRKLLASLTPATKPVAYLHRLRDAMADPTLSFEIARNPQWTSEPLYTSPAVPAQAGRAIALIDDYEAHGSLDHGIAFELKRLLQRPAQTMKVANRLRAMADNMGGSHAPELLELASLLQHPAQEK